MLCLHTGQHFSNQAVEHVDKGRNGVDENQDIGHKPPASDQPI
jgi:hypothetical protein